MKTLALAASMLFVAILLGLGLAVVIPQEAYACECDFTPPAPPVSFISGPCPKDPTMILVWSGCIGRYVCPPYNPCHCSYKGCYDNPIPHETEPDPQG